MAGAGYKLFNTGDVLTAAQVNTYLQEQAVMRFATTAARTTALAGVLSEGMVSYIDATDTVEVYNGSAWVSVAGASSPLTTKGDLYTYSTTNARLGVGNNGETLVADSSASTGLRWQPTGSTNYVINGLFDIWQRGTSSTTSGAYATADRWVQGVFSGSGTFAQTTAALATGTQFSMRFTASATTQPYLVSVIETQNAVTLAGRQVTLSGFFATSSSSNVTFRLDYTTSTDSAWNATYTTITPDSGSESAATTTSLVRRQVSYTIPASARTLRVYIDTSSTIANTATLTVGGIQLELGATATALRRSGGTLAGELAACQRYYWRTSNVESNGRLPGIGGFTSTTNGFATVQFPVAMRTNPTSVDYASLTFYDYNTGITVTNLALTANGGCNLAALVTITVASGGTQYRPAHLAASATTGYIGMSAEL